MGQLGRLCRRQFADILGYLGEHMKRQEHIVNSAADEKGKMQGQQKYHNLHKYYNPSRGGQQLVHHHLILHQDAHLDGFDQLGMKTC
jgi:hypothetical protein